MEEVLVTVLKKLQSLEEEVEKVNERLTAVEFDHGCLSNNLNLLRDGLIHNVADGDEDDDENVQVINVAEAKEEVTVTDILHADGSMLENVYKVIFEKGNGSRFLVSESYVDVIRNFREEAKTFYFGEIYFDVDGVKYYCIPNTATIMLLGEAFTSLCDTALMVMKLNLFEFPQLLPPNTQVLSKCYEPDNICVSLRIPPFNFGMRYSIADVTFKKLYESTILFEFKVTLKGK